VHAHSTHSLDPTICVMLGSTHGMAALIFCARRLSLFIWCLKSVTKHWNESPIFTLAKGRKSQGHK